MPKLTIVTHHYNGHDKAQALVSHMNGLPADIANDIELLVVDDFSDKACQLSNSGGIQLKQLRITDDIAWNQSGARNLGAMLSRSNWLLFFDIDQQPNLSALEKLIKGLSSFESKTMYFFYVSNFIDSNLKIELSVHPNTFMVNKYDFIEFGMYDEDFAGHYGFEDIYLPYVWEKNGGRRIILGNSPFFEDQNFKTSAMNRSIDRNKDLANKKVALGSPRAKSFIRFSWIEI